MTKDDIIRTIEAADWAELPGATEEPTTADSDLRALLDGDEKARAEAFFALREQLVTDWTWSEAGAEATPILLAVARLEAHPARAMALILLADILAGDHVLRSNDGIDMSLSINQELYAEGPARRIYETILSATANVVALLRDADPSVRSAAGFLLAFLSAAAPNSLEAVRQAAQVEREPWVQASLFLSLGFLARYSKVALRAADLDAWVVNSSPVPRAFAWLAELYAEVTPPAEQPGLATDQRVLGKDELSGERRQRLLHLFREGDPPLELFPWNRAHVDRTVTWQFMGRGDHAKVFVAGALGEVAAEGGPLASRMAKETLRLCFEEGDEGPPPWVAAESLDEGRRGVVAALSRRDYDDLSFVMFGLPPSASDRRRWLALDPPTALERAIDVDGQTVPLWQHLYALRWNASSPSRTAMLADIAAHTTGADRVEVIALVLEGAYALAGLLRIDDLYEALREGEPGAITAWARERLAGFLVSLQDAARRSPVATALVWAVARMLPPGSVLPSEYDQFVRIAEPTATRDVLEHLPIDRRDAVVLAYVRQAAAPTLNRRAFLDRLLPIADLVGPAAAPGLLRLADTFVEEVQRSGGNVGDAEALRERLRERLSYRSLES
jgi:hypothetical protein